MKTTSKGITRRKFLTGAGGAAVLAATSASFVGCSPSNTSKTTDANSKSAQATSWRDAPTPIGDDQIKETFEAEVVVVGAGISGCVAAMSAAEAGLSTIVLQKTDKVLNYASGVGSYDCAEQIANGATEKYDVRALISEWMRHSMNIPDRSFIELWRTRSGKDMDWLYSTLKDSGIDDPVWDWSEDIPLMSTYNMIDAMPLLAQKAADKGVDFHFSTPAIQLVRGEDNKSGRVTAVIAQNSDGDYLKFTASKGVLLCAGDYGNEPEIRKEYLPHAEGFASAYPQNVNTGDGLKMGVWIGAAMDQGPHCTNIHYDLIDGTLDQTFGSAIPWLRVNSEGNRFSNEDVEYDYVPLQDARQPERIHFDIFDSDFDEYYPKMGGGLYRGWPTPELCSPVFKEYLDERGFDYSSMSDYAIILEAGVQLGTICRGDTIEELADQLGIPAASLSSTVKRYNELAEKGEDEDYGKPAEILFPIEKAPFYGIRKQAYILSCLNGLTINDKAQVLDEKDEVIEGLYACGINSGGQWFAGLLQPMNIPGLPAARSVITARIAVEDIAAH